MLVDIVGLIDLHAIDRGPLLTSHLLQSAPGWVGTRLSRCPARSAPPPRRCDTQKHEACACHTPRGLSHALPPPWQAPWQAPKPSKHSTSYTPPMPPSVPPSVAGPSPAPCPQRCALGGVSANLGPVATLPFTRFQPSRAAFEVRRARPVLAVPARSGYSTATSRVVTSQPDAQCSTDISNVRGWARIVMDHDRPGLPTCQPRQGKTGCFST